MNEGLTTSQLKMKIGYCTNGKLSAITTYGIHQRKERKEMFYLTTHSTHFIDSYIASDIYGKGPLR